MKLYIFTLTFVIIFAVPLSTAAQEPSWLMRLKQMSWINKVGRIEVLKTTRAEAEQILGKPYIAVYEKTNLVMTYHKEFGRVIITFTSDLCRSNSGKFTKDVVESVSFTPESDILFSTLKIPVRQFKISKLNDTPGLSYENKRYGIEIIINNKNERIINSIILSSPKREKVECPY